MAKKKTRLEELEEYARGVGLTVKTWSPGDGTTRYRFFDQPGPSQTYFGPASGAYTALGIKDAWNYLYGYGAARSTRSTRSHSTRAQAPNVRANKDRLFTGVFPTGISYADRAREKHGDYLRLAFLPFSSLKLEWSKASIPKELRALIVADAKKLQDRRGELYQISSAGQTVRLGQS